MLTPTVAICIPSGRTWEAEMALGLVNVIGGPPCSCLVMWQMGSQITQQRNELTQRALDNNCTHIFWLDSDIVIPRHALADLLEHGKEIVGATYCKKTPPYDLLGYMEQADGRLKPSKRLPGGCMLVETDVYRKLEWPWYFEVPTPEKRTTTSEDYNFCDVAKKAGFDIWCDWELSQQIQHIGFQAVRIQQPGGDNAVDG